MDTKLNKLLDEEIEILEKLEKTAVKEIKILLHKKLALITSKREEYEKLVASKYDSPN